MHTRQPILSPAAASPDVARPAGSSRTYDRWAPVGAAEANAQAADWAEIAAEQNSRLGLQPGANSHGPQRAAVQPPPAPRQEGAADWADIAAAANARLPAGAKIPGKEAR